MTTRAISAADRAPQAAFALRPYQQSAVDQIRAAFLGEKRVRRVLYVLPTGGGKTVVFTHIVGAYAAVAKRALIIAHRIEILNQIAGAAELHGIKYGRIAAGQPITDDAVQIASVKTLVSRIEKGYDYDLIIVDEAHHSAAGSWRKILAAAPNTRLLGVTATPQRLDGKGLDDIYEVLILGPDVRELVRIAQLCPAHVYAPSNEDLDRALAHIKKVAADGWPSVETGAWQDARDYPRSCGLHPSSRVSG